MSWSSSPRGAMHYLDRGTGPVVVLLHGLGSHAEDWQPQLAALASSYRIIAPDLRGHGDSASPPGPWCMADFADDVLHLLGTLELVAYHLVGFSLGGMVAFELAQREPARLLSLTLINSGPPQQPRPWFLIWTYWQRVVVIRTLGLKRLGPLIGKRLFPREDQADLRGRFTAQLARMSRPAYLASLNAIYRWRCAIDYTALSMPTLVISADQDYTPVAVKRAYCRRLPRARLVVVADSRHATPLDQAAQVNALLREHFESVSQR